MVVIVHQVLSESPVAPSWIQNGFTGCQYVMKINVPYGTVVVNAPAIIADRLVSGPFICNRSEAVTPPDSLRTTHIARLAPDSCRTSATERLPMTGAWGVFLLVLVHILLHANPGFKTRFECKSRCTSTADAGLPHPRPHTHASRGIDKGYDKDYDKLTQSRTHAITQSRTGNRSSR